MAGDSKKIQPWYLETINGDSVPEIVDYFKKPLLILFFNLLCPGCVGRAIPFANRVALEQKNKVNVLGIHTTFEGPELTNDKISTKMKELYARFPFYRDAGLASTYYKYRAAGTPHWILTNKDGRIIQNIFGSEPNRALLRLDLSLKQLS